MLESLEAELAAVCHGQRTLSCFTTIAMRFALVELTV